MIDASALLEGAEACLEPVENSCYFATENNVWPFSAHPNYISKSLPNKEISRLLYNFGSLRQADSSLMPLYGFEQGGNRPLGSGRRAVIFLASVALVVSLASRTFQSAIYLERTVHAQFVGAKIQHRDRDAVGWIPPMVGLFLLWAATPSAPVEPTEKYYVRAYDQSLYNRPPPLA